MHKWEQLRLWFAKPLYGLKPYQGFESLPLRQINHLADFTRFSPPATTAESAESTEPKYERRGPTSGPTPVSFYPFAESIERFSGDNFNARTERAAGAKSGAAVVPQELTLRPSDEGRHPHDCDRRRIHHARFFDGADAVQPA